MNVEAQPDKLKEALAELIMSVTQTAGQAKDFLIAETPDVIRQLLMWKFAENLTWCLAGVAVMIAVVIYARRLVKWTLHEDTDSEDAVTGLLFGGAGLLIIFAIAAIEFVNLTWLQIWIAPKVYLLEYAKELVK